MSAKHALLGLLLQGSAYPYQLADRLEARLGPAWSVDSGQLYKTIKQMESDGLIERADDEEGQGERRHVCAITESGAEEFERWFDAATGGARLHRRPLLVKVTLAGPERLKEALEQVDAYELDRTARLKELLRTRDEIPPQGLQARADHLLLRVNLGADIYQLEGELKWARDAHDVLSRLLSQEAIWPSAPERSGAAPEKAHDRQGAREELFDKMAAKHLRSTPDRKGRADGKGV
jgi:DNA-binding PadR family transcriptional regulator